MLSIGSKRTETSNGMRRFSTPGLEQSFSILLGVRLLFYLSLKG
jgi:hypothetical protein